MEHEKFTLQSLNDLYRQYSRGLLKKKNFEELLLRIILDDLKFFNLYKWKKDDCLDFLSWVYPRLSRSIDAYNKNGATFESYICSLIRWSAREYRSRHRERQTAEQAVWMARFPELYAHEDEPDYLDERNDNAMPNPDTKPVKNPRQSLILILKCYYCLSDDFLDRLAPRVGMKKERLKKMVESLRKQRTRRDEASHIMRENIHSQYYRCIVYENKLKSLTANSVTYLKVESQLQKARRRLEAMRGRLAKLRQEATNMQIANVLGVAKGTVDSNFYALKTRMQAMEDILPSETPAEPGSYNP